jgi:hypothetical protein
MDFGRGAPSPVTRRARYQNVIVKRSDASFGSLRRPRLDEPAAGPLGGNQNRHLDYAAAPFWLRALAAGRRPLAHQNLLRIMSGAIMDRTKYWE